MTEHRRSYRLLNCATIVALALAILVVILLASLDRIESADAAGPPISAPAPAPSSDCPAADGSGWAVGDQWGPGPDDVFACPVDSGGEPVPSDDPSSGDRALGLPQPLSAPESAPDATPRPTPVVVGIPDPSARPGPSRTLPPTDTAP